MAHQVQPMLDQDRRGISPTAITFSSSSLELAATLWERNATAPVVVLVHGWKDHGRMWDGVARALAVDYRVLAPDLRGHGDSAWSPDSDYSTLAMLGDLNALVDQCAGKPVSLVAHSMGADLAMRYAAAFPEKVECLFAIEGFGLGAGHRRRLFRRPVHERYRRAILDRSAAPEDRGFASVDEARTRYAQAHPKFSAELVSQFVAHGLSHDPGLRRWFWKRDPRLVPSGMVAPELNTLRQLWRQIKCPVMHLHGTASPFADPEREGLMACFQAARYTQIKGAGHWPHHDNPDEFIAILREFLA